MNYKSILLTTITLLFFFNLQSQHYYLLTVDCYNSNIGEDKCNTKDIIYFDFYNGDELIPMIPTTSSGARFEGLCDWGSRDLTIRTGIKTTKDMTHVIVSNTYGNDAFFIDQLTLSSGLHTGAMNLTDLFIGDGWVKSPIVDWGANGNGAYCLSNQPGDNKGVTKHAGKCQSAVIFNILDESAYPYTGGSKKNYGYFPSSDEQFLLSPKKAITGHNTEKLTNVSISKALSECKNRGWCKSIDYNRKTKVAYLQKKDVSDVGKLASNSAYDHYQNCFPLTKNASIPGHNIKILSNISVADALAECRKNSWCKSIDYDKKKKIAYLQNKDISDVGKLKSGTSYDHYQNTCN